jgi:acetylornithine deacetylase/succinyl-diaminopimelate desuccinylase-like protein
VNEVLKSETVELLQALIQNACVNDGTVASGHEYRSVETLNDYFGVEGTVFEPKPGRQSLLHRIEGSDPSAPSLLLMGHTDVVPVNASGWSRDPFGAEISDGFVWGRGAIDMLNVTAAMAVVFKPYLTGEVSPPPGDLLYLAVADEEAAGTHGAKYLTEHSWDLVGADFVLTEIAYPPIDLGGGVRYPVSVGEKGPFWTHVHSTGTPGHGSTPYGSENALEPLIGGLASLFEMPDVVGITDVWRAFVIGLGLDPGLEAELLDPDRIDRAIDRINASDPRLATYLHACTHLTVSPNVIEGGVKANMIPDVGVAQIDLRAVPGQDRDDVDRFLGKAMGRYADRLRFEPQADFAATESRPAGTLWEVIVDAIEDVTGSRAAVPTLMPASTDARFFRARGSIAYGVGLFDDLVSFPDFLAMFHGNDERVSIQSVGLTVSLLERVLDRWRST